MDIMLDLETLSSAPDAAIIAIGACAFGSDLPKGLPRPTFVIYVQPESAQHAGGRVDAATVKWWCRQSDDARRAWTDADARPIAEALRVFSWWCSQASLGRPVRMWGNGASFDNIVLRGAYERCGIEPPWKWPNDRCYRTLKNLCRNVEIARIGSHHNALDDALSQAIHAERIFATLFSPSNSTQTTEASHAPA